MTARTFRYATAAVVLLGAVATAGAAAPAGCTAPGATEAGYQRLWDGVSDPTQSGWTHSGPGSFTVVDDGPAQGCRLLSQGGLGLLWFSAERYSDYVLRLQFRTDDATDNSGVFVGFPASGDDTHNAAINLGYEVQIREGVMGDGEDQKTGAIYNQQRELQRAARAAGQWNDYEIKVESPLRGSAAPASVQGLRVTATLNGTVVNVFQGRSTRGTGLAHIGLQNHGTNDAVSFRNLRIAPLRDDVSPTTTASTDKTPDATGSYPGPVAVTLAAADQRGGTGVAATDYRVDGGPWQSYGGRETAILDGTQASFDAWRHAGPGQFVRLSDGSIVSSGGLGMLWYPVEYGDVSIRLQYRDLRADGGGSNSGVFIRFPDPDQTVARGEFDRLPCQVGTGQTKPEWSAVYCGQEIQVYDGPTGEPQKTGSVYNFQPLDLAASGAGPAGQWVDYEVRVTGGGDYTVTVLRDGKVINTYVNTPGKTSSRGGDPGTVDRQFARGFLGLQNHSFADYMQFRDVRVRDLTPPSPVTVSGAGSHLVEFRSTDRAGNAEDIGKLSLPLR